MYPSCNGLVKDGWYLALIASERCSNKAAHLMTAILLTSLMSALVSTAHVQLAAEPIVTPNTLSIAYGVAGFQKAASVGEVFTSGLVYLECTTQQHWADEPRTVHWQITLNEAAGSVDYNGLGTGDRRVAARFTYDTVTFIGFVLSRVDLTMRREFSGIVEDGKCRISTGRKRAF